MVLYRPDEISLLKLNNKKRESKISITTYMKKKCSKNIFKLFESTEKTIFSCVKPLQTKKVENNTEVFKFIKQERLKVIDSTKPIPKKTCSISNFDETNVDHGYVSIPNSIQSATTSYSSLASLSSILNTLIQSESGYKSSKTNSKTSLSFNSSSDLISCTSNIKIEITSFLNNIQNGIDIYVRPSIVLNILSNQQCFDLFQNVEKVI